MKTMSNKVKRRLCTAVFILSIIMFICFALSFAEAQKRYRHSDGDLQTALEIRGETAPFISGEVKAEMDEASLRAAEHEAGEIRQKGYNRLKEENADVVGWISIENTKVDYPVMQTAEEPDYYYRRGFDGKYSSYGMIYMDASCTLEPPCPNYILYGHHMKNGAMFASLEKYGSEGYYLEHPVIDFELQGKLGTYEIVGAVRLPADKLNNEFAAVLAAGTQEDYETLIQYVKEHSAYDTGITAEWPTQLLTLTTCEYTQKDGRFLVVARAS